MFQLLYPVPIKLRESRVESESASIGIGIGIFAVNFSFGASREHFTKIIHRVIGEGMPCIITVLIAISCTQQRAGNESNTVSRRAHCSLILSYDERRSLSRAKLVVDGKKKQCVVVEKVDKELLIDRLLGIPKVPHVELYAGTLLVTCALHRFVTKQQVTDAAPPPAFLKKSALNCSTDR